MVFDKRSRILIIGAGVGGLSTAYWLKKRGYDNVTVLEKHDRVGGLCKSLTVRGSSFDLGANFITRAYKHTRALAKEYGASMYSEEPFYVLEAPLDDKKPVTYDTLFHHVRVHDDGSTTPVWLFTLAVLRFAWLRFKLAPLMDAPTYEGVARRPELCIPFDKWLRSQRFWGRDLEYYLGRLFQVPITMMGYGQLHRTATPYALKFMTLQTFLPMCIKATPVVGRYLSRWPKRLDLGFQRLWERVAWDLDVRTGVEISEIDRSRPEEIRVSFSQRDQNLDDLDQETHTLGCDALILACPLHPETLSRFMRPTAKEQALFERITFHNYCMTTHDIDDLGGGLQLALGASSPLLCVFPEDDQTIGRPWAVAQANANDPFVQFYTRIDSPPHPGAPEPPDTFQGIRREVRQGCKGLIEQMGIDNVRPPRPAKGDAAWQTFDRWRYFQHVTSEDIKEGWYDTLADMQGQGRTFYVGGATTFELIEPIMAHTRDLVERHFPGDPLPGAWRWMWVVAALGLVALVVVVFSLGPPKQLHIDLPISQRTEAATTASKTFWSAYHTQEYDRIPELIELLEHGLEGNEDDEVLSSLLSATHLWRFQERRRIGGSATDHELALVHAMSHANHTMELAPRDEPGNELSVPSTFAPAVHAVSRYQLGRVKDREDETTAAMLELLQNAIDKPEFDGFVMGWVVSATVDRDDPRFAHAERGSKMLMDACAGFEVEEDQVFTTPVMMVLALKAWLQPELRLCYNNPIAPHNLEGYFLAAGDFRVHQGEFDLARISYENATRMPTFDTWPFKNVVLGRLNADLHELQLTFASQVPMLDIPLDAHATMAMRSGNACAHCHAAR